MKSVNMLVLVGNVGNDPEVRSTTGGTRVATLSLATTEVWGKDEQKKEKTEWHRVVLWSGLADIVEKYVKKGDRLYVQGRVEYRQWQDKDGQTRYSTEVRADEVVLLGGKGNGKGRAPARDDFDGDEADTGPRSDDRESAADYFDARAEEQRAAAAAKRTPAKNGTRKR